MILPQTWVEFYAQIDFIASEHRVAVVLPIRRQFDGCHIRAHVYPEASSPCPCSRGSSATASCRPLSSCSHGNGLDPVAAVAFAAFASFSELLPCRILPLRALSCTTPGKILGGGGVPSIQAVFFACAGDMIIDDDRAGLL